MTFRAACLSAILVACGASYAAAGPVVDAAARAEALQAEGKTVEALDALNEAVDSIWTQGPLAFRKVVLVESTAPSGAYVERTDRTFRPDDKLVVHVEPVGYGYGGSGSGARIGFTGDLALENATGQILTEAKDLFSVSVDSAAGRREFDMTLSFQVPYVRPGEYIARFTIRDQNSDKTGSFDVPFTVAAPEAAPEPAGPAADNGGAADVQPPAGADQAAPQ